MLPLHCCISGTKKRVYLSSFSFLFLLLLNNFGCCLLEPNQLTNSLFFSETFVYLVVLFCGLPGQVTGGSICNSIEVRGRTCTTARMQHACDDANRRRGIGVIQERKNRGFSQAFVGKCILNSRALNEAGDLSPTLQLNVD